MSNHLLCKTTRFSLDADECSQRAAFHSAAAQLYADQWNCLAVENVEKLPFLAYNICLFNFDY